MKFEGRDLISITDLSRDEIEHALDVASKMESTKSPLLEGKILANMFYEPSTRTRLSFESAMLRLGGGVIGFSETTATSMAKGENLEDTVRVIEGYADIAVIRNWLEGCARMCAEISHIPVINAGDGTGEHPTQALLDLYTMRKNRKKIDGLEIAMCGDLKYGRTVHSLIRALALYDVKLHLVSPKGLEMPKKDVKEVLGDIEVHEHNDFQDIIGDLDVLYATRIQGERFEDQKEYERLKGSYKIDLNLLKKGKENLIVMHPLPRVDEIAKEVDNTTSAFYFQQSRNGVFVRMAILSLLLGKVK